MEVDKQRFKSSLEFERAKITRPFENIPPIERKIAGMCLKDEVVPDTNVGLGSCELSELCTFMNDKIQGASGICLKQIVGVE